MKRILLIVILASVIVGCRDFDESQRPSSGNNGGCSNLSPMPEGKGQIFRIGREDATKIAAADYLGNSSPVDAKRQPAIGQTVLFWYVIFPDSGTVYVIDRSTGRIVGKRLLPGISSNEPAFALGHPKTDCQIAINLSKERERRWLMSMGDNAEEASKEMMNYDTITIELPAHWLVLFDFRFYELSDLNDPNEIAELPNAHPPAYLIQKSNGEGEVVWR